MEWWPSDGLNLLVGGGDVGKSTILHSISLLFSPTNSIQLNETDYYRRSVEQGFVIEGVVQLPEEIGTADARPSLWPWEWNGKEAVLPDPDEDRGLSPVFKIRVRGTEDQEAVWELIQPNDETVGLSVGIRRRIGVVRLTTDDRNDRDLRLVSGSALDRLLSNRSLKARISRLLSDQGLAGALDEETTSALKKLDGVMQISGLPHGAGLGMASSNGISIGSLVALTASQDDVVLPATSWGAGTRRMMALEISSASQSSSRITVIDEVERGLEPYRLRQLMKRLVEDEGQSFLTTHSAVAVESGSNGTLWHLGRAGGIGLLAGKHVASQQRRDPETFMSKLPIIAEGVTEVGFVRHLLDTTFDVDPAQLGLRVCDGGGNESILPLIKTLYGAQLSFAAFGDNEGTNRGTWDGLKTVMGPLVLQWKNGCLEENIIRHIAGERLLELAVDADGSSGRRMRTIATRLGLESKSPEDILHACGATDRRFDRLREVITAAATGNTTGAPPDSVKEWKRHGRDWFKTLEGGRELAVKMSDFGVWPNIEGELLPFINALRAFAGRAPIKQGSPVLGRS
ncbi:ATP-dependent endonuclease [Rhizobium johnstonii]|uniref:ATP-dependent nuclease n=1 Tax=Rhizobium johnstonii TaxID=3019933 RepID=UPI003F996F89